MQHAKQVGKDRFGCKAERKPCLHQILFTAFYTACIVEFVEQGSEFARVPCHTGRDVYKRQVCGPQQRKIRFKKLLQNGGAFLLRSAEKCVFVFTIRS